MGFFVLAVAIFAVIVALIALFSRTETHETYRPSAGFPFQLGPAQLHELARAILTARGLRIEGEELRADGGSEIVASDPTPLLGGRLAARTLPGPAPAGSQEVQAALSEARGEALGKVLLLSPSGFSDESLVELIDGPRLLELARGAVDLNALRAGRVVARAETIIRAQQASTLDDLHAQ